MPLAHRPSPSPEEEALAADFLLISSDSFFLRKHNWMEYGILQLLGEYTELKESHTHVLPVFHNGYVNGPRPLAM